MKSQDKLFICTLFNEIVFVLATFLAVFTEKTSVWPVVGMFTCVITGINVAITNENTLVRAIYGFGAASWACFIVVQFVFAS